MGVELLQTFNSCGPGLEILSSERVMRMFCKECGKSVAEGSKFCLNCGNPLSAAPIVASTPAPVAPSPSPSDKQESEKKRGAAAFFSSAPGIALIVVISALLIAGIVVGAVFLAGSGSDSAVDAATVKVWDEYEEILKDDSADFATINMDPNALAKTREDLEKTQAKVEALEKTLKATGGTSERQRGTNTGRANVRDQKADQLAAAIEAYGKYIEKMNEFYGVVVTGNLLDPMIVNLLNAILKDLQTMSAEVKTLANDFLKGNDQVTATTFNFSILDRPAEMATEVEKSIQAKQEAERQRLEAEGVAAEQAAAAAEAERQRQAAATANQMVTCPNCGGAGTVEGGDGRYTCGFCNGTGRVTRSKASTYNPADWRDY